MNITTTGGAGAAGEIQITSDTTLIIGTLDTANLTSQNVRITTTFGADLTIVFGGDLDTDAVTLGGNATGVLTVLSNLNLGSLDAEGTSIVIVASISSAIGTLTLRSAMDVNLGASALVTGNTTTAAVTVIAGGAILDSTGTDLTAATANIRVTGNNAGVRLTAGTNSGFAGVDRLDIAYTGTNSDLVMDVGTDYEVRLLRGGGTGTLDTLTVIGRANTTQTIEFDAGLGVTTYTVAGAAGQVTLTTVTTSGIDFTYTAVTGNLVVGTVTASTVSLTATVGAIIDGNGAPTNIFAGTAALSAATGIGSADALETSVITLSFANGTSGNVQLTDADSVTVSGTNSAPGGTITLVATAAGSTLTVNGGNLLSTNGAITLRADDLTSTGTVNAGAGRVILEPVTVARVISLGANTLGTLGLDDAELDRITTSSVLQIGNLTNTGGIQTAGTITAPAGWSTLALLTAGAITDTTPGAAADITVANLRLEAGTGIGSTDALEINVIQLAFRNTTSGDVQITDTATGLTIASVDGLTTSSNTGGAVTLTALSPITFAVDTTSAGTRTATATESPTVNFDNITVNPGVTVSSTNGNVVFQAGDRIILNGTVRALGAAPGGSITLVSGFGDTDSDGGITLNGVVSANTTTGRVTLDVRANDGAVQTGGQITARELLLLGTGTSGSFTLDTSATNDVALLAASTRAFILYRDSNGLTVNVVGATNGITSNGADVILCTLAGDLSLNAPVNAGTGTVRLQAAANVTQSPAPVAITANALGVRAGGVITLTSTANDVAIFAAFTSSLGSAIQYTDATALTMDTVTASACFTATTVGVVSTNGNIILTVGNALTINRNLTAGTAEITLNVGLAVDANVTINNTATILATRTTINTGAGVDALIINNPAGSLFAPSGSFTYNAGGQAGDRLELNDGGAANLNETYSVGPGNHEGVIAFTGLSTASLAFTGVTSPIADSITVGTLTVNATGADNASIFLEDSPTANRLRVRVDICRVLEGRITLNGDAGNDEFAFANGASLTGGTANGGDGVDLLN